METKASHLIQEAVLKKSSGLLTEAKALFRQAARLESEAAERARGEDDARLRMITLLSALTCWYEADDPPRCAEIARLLCDEEVNAPAPLLREATLIVLDVLECALTASTVRTCVVDSSNWDRILQIVNAPALAPDYEQLPILDLSAVSHSEAQPLPSE